MNYRAEAEKSDGDMSAGCEGASSVAEDKEAALVRSWKEAITAGRQSSMCLGAGSTGALKREQRAEAMPRADMTWQGGFYIF